MDTFGRSLLQSSWQVMRTVVFFYILRLFIRRRIHPDDGADVDIKIFIPRCNKIMALFNVAK